MNEKEIAILRERYPEKYYMLTEKNGKLVIKPRTAVLWFPLRFIDKIAALSPEAVSAYIENLMAHSKLTIEYFNSVQKTITKECADKIAKCRKEMKCNKTALVAALFQENAKEEAVK